MAQDTSSSTSTSNRTQQSWRDTTTEEGFDSADRPKARVGLRYTLSQVRRDPTALVGLGIIGVMTLVALVAFVDSGSQQVFKEFQFRPLDQVTPGSSVSATRDGLELTAHRTYPGGPTRLQLNSTADGEPVDAQITVGPPGGRSSVVGRTGDDGSLWTVAPNGTYQVTAIDGSSVVVLSVEPTPTPSIYGATDNGTDAGTDTSETTTPTATPTG